ncbi:MAG: PHP domain-containing protein [Bacteroidales bacterium]
MKRFRADLHIHTVLSPCATLEMSPSKIVAEARNKELDMIGITDHNHTANCLLTRRLGTAAGLGVLMGTEVTTREEIHCLAYFPDEHLLGLFQDWMYGSILKVKNDPRKTGYQLIVDENEAITDEVDYYLGASLSHSIEEVGSRVHELEGIFIPAHIERGKNSVYSQLGFIPAGLNADAYEISARSERNEVLIAHPELSGECIVSNSDAHTLDQIGEKCLLLEMESCTFEEFRNALRKTGGRKVVL